MTLGKLTAKDNWSCYAGAHQYEKNIKEYETDWYANIKAKNKKQAFQQCKLAAQKYNYLQDNVIKISPTSAKHRYVTIIPVGKNKPRVSESLKNIQLPKSP